MITDVNQLTGAALDWAVQKCLAGEWKPYIKPSSDWAQGGPIIEREEIELTRGTEDSNGWTATIDLYEGDVMRETCTGPTPLIAAMRCYVASKLGSTVDVPDELLEVV